MVGSISWEVCDVLGISFPSSKLQAPSEPPTRVHVAREAGVNMRLTSGGVRELHWHTAAEWAIVLYGSARITAIDKDGKSFVADVKQNDLWYFPSGIPHSIQGLDPDGTEFMLVFDDGEFSEAGTLLLSDAMAHVPPEVLSKNFGVPEQALKNLPKQELFIFKAAVPGPLASDWEAAAGALGEIADRFRISHHADAADEAHERGRRAHRRFEHLQGLDGHCNGDGYGPPGRPA